MFRFRFFTIGILAALLLAGLSGSVVAAEDSSAKKPAVTIQAEVAVATEVDDHMPVHLHVSLVVHALNDQVLKVDVLTPLDEAPAHADLTVLPQSHGQSVDSAEDHRTVRFHVAAFGGVVLC